jgi:hypothetical protein
LEPAIEVKGMIDYKPKAPRNFAPPDESNEQRELFAWAAAADQRHSYPELLLMYAIPNISRRSFAIVQTIDNPNFEFVAPNICVPVPRSSFGALYLELRPAYAARRDVTRMTALC